MKYACLSLIIFLFAVSCKDKRDADFDPSASFYPLQIGNYWRINDQNYTEVQDTLRINNKLYYKLYSLVGGDAEVTRYLRLDENNQLWESYPNSPSRTYLHAKFNANLNDEFYTLNDKTYNDYKVQLVEKTGNKRTFEFDMVYHPNLAGHKHQRTYIKGQGPDDNWKHIRINGVVIK